MKDVHFGALPILLLMFGATIPGCGSNQGPFLAHVGGTVKLDGKPVPNAMVRFEPVFEGRPSLGITDSRGRYSLQFTQEHRGALLGEHVVRISTWTAGSEIKGTWQPGEPELIPARYNEKAKETVKMRREVLGRYNAIDFELSSTAGPLPKRREVEALARK